MGGEWRKTTIGQLFSSDGGSVKTGPFGTTLKAKEYSTEGVPLISVGEVGYGALRVHDKTPKAPCEVVERLPEYLLEAGDIVFGRKGAVDRSAIVKPEQAGWFLGSDGIRLRLPKTCDPRFVAYQLQSQNSRSWLLQHATGTTMASLNQNIIERVPIILPPLAQQRAIVHILGTLDDKIELNRRMNETLEAMARALFKSWFVDFDPVRAKCRGARPCAPTDIANLFPDSFEDSELGEIPEGWEIATLFDFATLNPETWSKETRPLLNQLRRSLQYEVGKNRRSHDVYPEGSAEPRTACASTPRYNRRHGSPREWFVRFDLAKWTYRQHGVCCSQAITARLRGVRVSRCDGRRQHRPTRTFG